MKQSKSQSKRLSIKNRYRFGWNRSDYLAQRAVRRHNISSNLSSVSVIEAAQSSSKGRYECISFKEGILKLGFLNYDQLVETKFEQESLIDSINQQLDSPQVKRINFCIKY